MSIANTSDLEITSAHPILIPLLIAVACVALADWLFYGWQVGISLALFFGVLGVVAVAGNRVQRAAQPSNHHGRDLHRRPAGVDRGRQRVVGDVGALTTALFVTVATARDASSWQCALLEAAIAPLRGPFQLAADLFGALQRMKHRIPEWLKLGSLVAWIIPLGVFCVFLGLFSSANPLIEHRLKQIDLRFLFTHSDPHADCVLDSDRLRDLVPDPAAHPARARSGSPNRRRSRAVAPSDPDYLFGVQAVIALADPVQRAVRAADRARSHLSVGRRQPARRHELRGICPSRRLSADRQPRCSPPASCSSRCARTGRRKIPADPAAGSGVDRAEHPARRSPRSSGSTFMSPPTR